MKNPILYNVIAIWERKENLNYEIPTAATGPRRTRGTGTVHPCVVLARIIENRMAPTREKRRMCCAREKRMRCTERVVECAILVRTRENRMCRTREKRRMRCTLHRRE